MSRVIAWGTDKTPEIRDGLVQFVGARVAGGHRGFGECVAMGVVEDGELLCGLIYHNFNPEAGVIEITGAASHGRWLTRPVLVAMSRYPFVDAGCQMVVMRVSEANVMWNGRGIRRILKRGGFVETRIERLRGRETAEIIYTLTDDAWASNGLNRQPAQEARKAA